MSFTDNETLFGTGDQVPHDVQIARILASELLESRGLTPVFEDSTDMEASNE